ncbi:MAG: hypothetical protein ACD_68C00034G0001 [uncultured bacterium]|nr:MAG: hypothetical protein ACD_68C00034G0001 [uncultured bacterium]
MPPKKRSYDLILASIFRLLYGVAAGYSIYRRDWFDLFFALAALILTYAPYYLARKKQLYIPRSFQTATLILIFGSLFLGSFEGFYEKFWWWDIMMHGVAGFIMSLIGLVIIYILNRSTETTVVLSPFFVALFSFNFSMMIGTMWEVYEFILDLTLHTDAQRNSLPDTMWDIIGNCAAALIVAIFGYIYSKHHQKSYIEKIEKIISNKGLKQN